jgi:selenocysteine lyase/cysteine desulfurase
MRDVRSSLSLSLPAQNRASSSSTSSSSSDDDENSLVVFSEGISLESLWVHCCHTMVNRIANSGEKNWSQIPILFDFSNSSCVPMNSANLCAQFTEVFQATNIIQQDLDVHSHMTHRIQLFKNVTEATRNFLAQKFKTEPENLAFLRNTSEANNNIHNTFVPRKSNGRITVWNKNHPTNDAEVWNLRFPNSDRVDVVCLTQENLKDKESIIKAFLGKISPDTELVSFSAISNGTGLCLPYKELCHAIHAERPDIHIHVDGAQILGCSDFDFVDLDCDSFSASFHKWYCGPREIGLLYMKSDAISKFRLPNTIAYDGKIHFYHDGQIPKNAQRYELLGQRNDATLGALGIAAKIHEWIDQNIGNIHNRVHFLTSLLIQKISEKVGKFVKFITPTTEGLFHNIVVFELLFSGKPGDDLYAFLAEKNDGFKQFFAAPQNDGKALRLCCNFFNTEDHLDEVVQKICRWIELMDEKTTKKTFEKTLSQ